MTGGMRFQESWTDEEYEMVRKLKAEGLTYAQIGKRLGRSKDAIVGCTRRLGLCTPKPVYQASLPRKPKRPDPLPWGAVTLPPLPSLIGFVPQPLPAWMEMAA